MIGTGIALALLALLGLGGCAGIDGRTTGSATMNEEWIIAPRLNFDEFGQIPKKGETIDYVMRGETTPRKLDKDGFLAAKMWENGGSWTVNTWIAGSNTPSISMVSRYWCPPGAWGNLNPGQRDTGEACAPMQEIAASDGGYFKPLAVATMIGGTYIGGQLARRPSRTEVNQSGGGASSGAQAGAYSRSTSTSFGQKVGKAWGGK